MKRENKKALTATRNENRARAMFDLQSMAARLRSERDEAEKKVVKLETEVAALKAAQS